MPGKLLFSFAMLAALFIFGAGCGKTENAVKDEPAAENVPSRQNGTDTKLNQSVALAKIHIKHKEFHEAETVLESTLKNADSGDTTEALTLLDQVKTELAQAAAFSSQPSSALPNRVVEQTKPPTQAAKPDEPNETDQKLAKAKGQNKDVKKPASPTPAKSGQTNKSDTETAQQQPKIAEKKAEIVKSAVSDVDLRRLENEAHSSETVGEALRLYEDFLHAHILNDKQAATFNEQYSVWKDRSEKKMVRLGLNWVLLDEAEAAAREADQLVEQAKALLKVGNYQAAVSYLDDASKLDPNGIRADFVLGLLYSFPYFLHQYSEAEKRFQTVLKRFPGHVGALNNLAITEVKRRQYSQAYNHWREAVHRAPGHPDVGHNLGRLINAASQKKIIVNRSELANFNKLYAEFVTTHKGTSAALGIGWRYSPLVLPEKEKQREEKLNKQVADKDGRNLFYYASGTGFVVHDSYLITNRHVIKDSKLGLPDSVGIVDPGDPKHEKEFRASVVAVSKDRDLAILKCEELKAPRLSVDIQVPQRGTEVMVLGYPHTDHIGRSLKATKGIVSADINPLQEDMLMFDAEANPGNSGGPVCNQKGDVVAVMTVKFNEAIGDYSGGIPMNQVIPFVKQNIPNYRPQTANDGQLDWISVDRRNAASTVLIRIYYKEFPFALNRVTLDTKVKRQHYLEDVSCVVCNGSGRRSCPSKGCSNGKKKITRRIQSGFNPLTKRPTYQFIQVRIKCPNCNGSGAVDCPHCAGGIDLQLR